MYDLYLRGYSRLLDGLYLLRSYRRFIQKLDDFEDEADSIAAINDNARMIWQQIIYVNRINKHFWEGTFAEGIRTIPEVERYIRDYGAELDIHHRMVLCYKIACLYFGHGDYRKCMDYLGRIISTRDPRIHRDLQCYARILNLIASYEAGIDYNLDYQVRSVCLFLVKMNDMHQVQQEIMAFLKRLNSMYATNLKEEPAPTVRTAQTARAPPVRTPDVLLPRHFVVAREQTKGEFGRRDHSQAVSRRERREIAGTKNADGVKSRRSAHVKL